MPKSNYPSGGMNGCNILYVFDETAKWGQYFHIDKESTKIFLCPLTVNQGCISTIAEKLRAKTKGDIIPLNFPKLFNEKAFSMRDEYLQFVAEFAEKKFLDGENLKEFFRSKNFSTWWFSLIAEKNTLKSDSYHKLCQFLTILDIQKKYSCDEIWLDISDPELTQSVISQEKIGGFTSRVSRNSRSKSDSALIMSNFVKTFGYFLLSLLRFLKIKTKMRRLNARKEILKNSRFLLVTYFPFFDEKQLERGKFIDKYYQPIQNALERKREQFAWLALIVRAPDFDWGKSVALGRQINEWGYPLYFSDEWLTLRDLFAIFGQYTRLSTKFLSKLPTISREFNCPDTDRNVWQIFKKDWYNSFCGITLFQGLAYHRLFNRAFSQLRKNTTITYVAEMHAWEKALNMAAREKKWLKVIGVQHTIVPLLLLNYFNHKTELRYGDNISTMPKPDYLACVGKIPAKLFKDSGWEKKRVFVLGAIRFQHYKKYLGREIPWNNRENKVVVALSISPEESREVLFYVYQAFKDQRRYQVIIKGHPFCPVRPLVDSLGIHLDKNVFKIVETPLSELLPTAKAMIVTESSATLESIACQCPVIVPLLPNMVDMNPLSGISDLPVYVSSPEELRKVVEKIVKRKKSPISFKKCKTFIEKYCDFPDSDEEFLRRISEV